MTDANLDTKGELKWSQLLDQNRRKPKTTSEPQSGAAGAEVRTEIERDHDRILFSTPVRRLADKTQVFPLEKNDSVRTRLTHSHEVSNLARSIGTVLAFKHDVARDVEDSRRNLPALSAAVGLVHDLGNPPFGHQGESAIQSWFNDHQAVILKPLDSPQHRQDFLKFEGNAQGFRLVTRLQLLNDDFGLDLTFATLAAMMKYPTPSHQTSDDSAATKKHGFFAAEQPIVDQMFAATGLAYGRRHPLASVMEACDDIAYVVLDVEDAVKKGLASVPDVFAFLRHQAGDDPLTRQVVDDGEKKHKHYRETANLSPSELNDVSMQRFRVYAIGALVTSATETFVQNEASFLRGATTKTLLAQSRGERLRKALKEFALRHAYQHKSVLQVELEGHNVIRGLMDMFWASIVNRTDPAVATSPRKCPFSRYVYGKISENYRRVFENPTSDGLRLPIRYRECLLLTDMISGMTDSFAVDMHDHLQKLSGAFDAAKFLKAES